MLQKEDMERIKQNLLTTAEVIPVPEDAVIMFKVIDKYMSTTSWDDIGTASADLLEQSMIDQVKDTASGFVDRAGELGENVNLARPVGTKTSGSPGTAQKNAEACRRIDFLPVSGEEGLSIKINARQVLI